MKEQNKLWTLPFTLLVLANLFTFMSFQMLLPTLPPYMKALGGSDLQVGLVTALFTVSAILIRPYIGFLLESQTRKKLVLIGSLGLLLMTTLYAFVQIIFIFLLLRFMHGIAWGWSTTSNGTAAVDIIPRKRIGEGMGYFSLSVTLGMIIAPSLGIYIYQNLSYTLLIILATSLGVIAFILFSIIEYITPESVQKKEFNLSNFSFFGSLIEKKSWFPAVVTLLNSLGYGSIITFIVIFGEEKGLSGIFLFYFFNAICATLVRPITGKMFDKRGPWLLIIVCALIAFGAMWVLSLANSNIDLIISGALFGIGYGSMMPAFNSWVISKTSVERSGVANGMFYSSIDFGIGLSAILFGFISTFVSTAFIFKISSFCFMAVALLTFIDYKKQQGVWVDHTKETG